MAELQAAALVEDHTHQTDTVQPDRREVLFDSVEWADLAALSSSTRALAEFASLTHDVAAGVEVVLSIAERDDCDADCCDDKGNDLPALLGPVEHGRLGRLCRASLRLLADEALRRLEAAAAARH